MKSVIYCPYCMERGKRTIIGKHEDVIANQGYVEFWCRWCRKPIHVELKDISLDQ